MSECFLEDIFAKQLSQEICKNVWSKFGADPRTSKCLSESKLAHEMVSDDKKYPVADVYRGTQHKNEMCMHHLIYMGCNGNLLSENIKKKIKSLKASLKVPHL